MQGITSAIEVNTEKLADMALENHEEAREWHNEEAEKLEEVSSGIRTWKEQVQSKEDCKYRFDNHWSLRCC